MGGSNLGWKWTFTVNSLLHSMQAHGTLWEKRIPRVCSCLTTSWPTSTSVMMESCKRQLSAESSSSSELLEGILSALRSFTPVCVCEDVNGLSLMSCPCSTHSNWEMCAQMYATFQDTDNPAKFRMQYWGVASYLQTGGESAWFSVNQGVSQTCLHPQENLIESSTVIPVSVQTQPNTAALCLPLCFQLPTCL